MAKWKPSKGYRCSCGTCAAEKAARISARREERKLRRAAEAREQATRDLMLRLGAQCLALFQAHKDVTWTSGSGRTTRVQAMDRAHLHYAIAKGERGEYWDSGTRAKLPALKAEALRRILNDLGWTCMPWFGKGLDARLAATGDPG